MLTVAFGVWQVYYVQLWYNRIKEGREDINDDTRPRSLGRSTKNNEAIKKIILDNHRITIREFCWWCWHIVRLMPSNFSSQRKRPEEPRLKKALQVRSNVKVLLTIFLIAMAWCIINSCHKVVQTISNITLKLCADCMKQFVRNAQNCGKTNHGFCISSYIDACAWIFGQKQNHNHASITVFTGIGPRWLFPLLNTEDTDERKTWCYDWGDNRKIDKETVGRTVLGMRPKTKP